jgi:hypothetical protein
VQPEQVFEFCRYRPAHTRATAIARKINAFYEQVLERGAAIARAWSRRGIGIESAQPNQLTITDNYLIRWTDDRRAEPSDAAVPLLFVDGGSSPRSVITDCCAGAWFAT